MTDKKEIDFFAETMKRYNADQVYKIPVRCTNCELTGIITKKKGSKFDPRIEMCGNCGCTTIVRTGATQAGAT
jgi:hypothetical protein